MPTQEDIADQQELLAAYRRTLAQYRQQEALSGEAFVPPAVMNGIQDARAEIRRIKTTLRAWGVTVEDYPDDEELPQVAKAAATNRLPRLTPLAWAGVAAALLVLVVGGIWLARRPGAVANQPSPTSLPATVAPTAAPPTLAPTAAPPTLAPTAVSTTAPPVFIVRYAFDPQQVELVTLVADPTMSATIPITDFLTISRVEFGSLEDSGEPAWNIGLRITNTSTKPIVLDLNQRFFVLNDNQGQAAPLLSFCCSSKVGELLEPGEQRDIRMVYRSVPGWYGKSSGVNTIFIRVTGLVPVVRAVWSFPPLLTAS
jgi:hypothetical protein